MMLLVQQVTRREPGEGPEMETDPKTGKEFMVKSLHSDLNSPVQFTNKTDEFVQIIWIDYSGLFQNYKTISPKAWIHVNTYVSHPWIFRHPATKERYMINGLPVFQPPPPKTIQNTMVRVKFEIHKPLRTLRIASLMKVASLLQNMEDAYQLSLPKQLAAEVEYVIDRRLTFIFLEQRRNR